MNRTFNQIKCFFCGEKMTPSTPRNKHCSLECRFKDIYRTLLPTINGCLEWPLSVGSHGYGQIYSGPHGPTTTHSLSWRVHRGDTKGMFVLHRCDNRRCINPNHLFLGTAGDNTADMIAKGRQQDYSWLRNADRWPDGKIKARA